MPNTIGPGYPSNSGAAPETGDTEEARGVGTVLAEGVACAGAIAAAGLSGGAAIGVAVGACWTFFDEFVELEEKHPSPDPQGAIDSMY